MQVIFDTKYLYYLPQYLPVYKELIDRGGIVKFVFYRGRHDHVIEKIASQEGIDFVLVDNEEKALSYYLKEKADWVVFSNTFPYLDELHMESKTAQMSHGIGPKSSFYTQSSSKMSVRFVEGKYRLDRLLKMYPDQNFVDVGFCKLDPIIGSKEFNRGLLKKLGLNECKKTLLYAPTFYPSSIERFDKKWPNEFKDFNIIIKPHYFSLSKPKYKKQASLLKRWSKFDNVYLANDLDYSLVPFFEVSDLLISDASSSLFEFSLLNKPVVWCDFLKLRWNYRGIFSGKFKKRMDVDFEKYSDIAVHARKYSTLKSVVERQLKYPDEFKDKRMEVAEQLAGKVDGLSSKRLVDYLFS